MKKAVITGATGMIGATLCRNLLQKGIEVLAVIRPNSSKRWQLPVSDGLQIMEADLSDLKAVGEKIADSYDLFFHLGWSGTYGASRDDMYMQNQNVRYTLDAVELAHHLGCSVFVGAGSQAEYGRREGKLAPDTPAFPENGYGMAKLCAGQMSRILCKKYGIRHEWTRILSVYGPFDGAQTMIMSGIRTLLEGGIPQYTKGEQMWDYLYSEDAAEALALIGEKGRDGQVYCIGSGQARPLYEYITELRNAVNPDAKIELGAIPYAPGQVMYLCADICNLTEDTGFMPRVSFKEGIRKTIHWVEENQR